MGRFTMGGKHNESWFKLNSFSKKKQVFFLSFFKKIICRDFFGLAKKCPVEGYRAWEDSLWGVSIMNRGSNLIDFLNKSKSFFHLFKKKFYYKNSPC